MQSEEHPVPNVLEILSTHQGDIYAILTALTWSLAVVCFRLAGDGLSSLSFNFFKSFAALLLFVLLVFSRGGPWIPDFSSHEWALIVLSSVFGITLGDWFYLISLKRIGASYAAVVSCLYSPLMITFAWLILSESPALSAIAGSLLIVSAVLIGYFEPKKFRISQKGWGLGVLFGVLTEASMVIAIVSIRDLFRREDVYTVMTIRFFLGSLFSVPLYLLFRAKKKIDLSVFFKYTAQIKWVWLGTFLGPFLSSIFWFLGFRHTEVARAAVLNQTSTVMIFVLAALILKEPMGMRRVFALLCAFGGVLLVTVFS